MAEEKKEEGQKTLVAFIVGLLIGGLLVWAFSGPDANAPDNQAAAVLEAVTDEEAEDTEGGEGVVSEESVEVEPTPTLEVGDGAVVVNDQAASASIVLESATYPVSEGWIGVREYNNEDLGFLLGVVRFSESQGLVPAEIALQRPTTAGREYAVVIYTEDGDFDFSLANDVQIDTIFDTFTAE